MDNPLPLRSRKPSPPRRRWIPWAAGMGTVGVLLSGGLLFPRHSTRPSPALPQETQEIQNRLAGEKSPYLRSAAKQPVAWQPWGKDAFRLAEELDRPVWLDVGAIWCHWCHVMDRESYDNPEIARLINDNFVAVKVDRDERPDIDTRYQTAQRALNGRGGGWPLTLWLTPDAQPFAGGTYFPPAARGGQPGLKEIIPQLLEAYHEQPGQVRRVTASLRDRLAQLRDAMSQPGNLSPGVTAEIADSIEASFDTLYGGFGTRQKFPHAGAVRFALAHGFLFGDSALTDHALQTLNAYARSGMRDYIGGGFFRYATDRRLTVPHFEKMDYVQAGLLRAYLDAYRLTAEERYAVVAREIMRYVNATLSDRSRGGFYAHQDADISLDDDGSYYTWSLEQIKNALPEAEYQAVRLYYGVENRGEMREDPDQNVLRVARSAPEVAATLGISEPDMWTRILSARHRLQRVRAGPNVPLVERTKFTDRNGMMAVAYLEAYETLGDTDARYFALKTVDFLLAHAVEPDGAVFHATAEGESYSPGLLRDYANLTEALTAAYQVSGDREYLRTAERVMGRAVARFWDEAGGGFYDRPTDPEATGLLAQPSKEFVDSPQPGANAVAASALNHLYLLTSRDRWRSLAAQTLKAFAGSAAKSSTFAATYGLAAEAHLNKPPQVVVIGAANDPLTEQLTTAAWGTYRPGRMVTSYDPATAVLDSLPEAVAAAARASGVEGKPKAYVCVGHTCAPPTSAPATVVSLVRDYGRADVR